MRSQSKFVSGERAQVIFTRVFEWITKRRVFFTVCHEIEKKSMNWAKSYSLILLVLNINKIAHAHSISNGNSLLKNKATSKKRQAMEMNFTLKSVKTYRESGKKPTQAEKDVHIPKPTKRKKEKKATKQDCLRYELSN